MLVYVCENVRVKECELVCMLVYVCENVRVKQCELVCMLVYVCENVRVKCPVNQLKSFKTWKIKWSIV